MPRVNSRTPRLIAVSASVLMTIAATSILEGCGSSGEGGRFAYFIALNGLADLTGVRGHYEGWAVINGLPFSTGKFIVLGTGPGAEVRTADGIFPLGTAASAQFGPSSTNLGENFPRITEASHLFITFEPEGDHDRQPSCMVLMAGEIIGDQAQLSTNGVVVPSTFPCAQDNGNGTFRLGLGDFSQATGIFRLMTPTNDPGPADDQAGVWFVNDTGGGNLVPGLVLPPAPGGFRYEGFARVDGTLRSTGTFVRADVADDDAKIAPLRGDQSMGPAAPGQDFVVAFMPPPGLNPPALRLSSAVSFADGDYRAFITVEPFPDNDSQPFRTLQILSQNIDPDLVDQFDRGIGELGMTSTANALPTTAFASGAPNVMLTAIQLSPLSSDSSDRRGHYELWVVNQAAVTSLGKFIIQSNGDVLAWPSMAPLGTTASSAFALPGGTFAPTEAFITIECQGDVDAMPSAMVIQHGNVTNNGATLTVAGNAAIGGRGIADFSTISGSFQLDTATDDTSNFTPNDSFGILYRRTTGADVNAASLTLPTLPAGWRYEGWIEERTTGRCFSSGKFARANGPDDDDMTSLSRGPDLSRGFPGQDFLVAVTPTPIPAAIVITEVMIGLEPLPDNSTAPFFLPILFATVPGNAVAGGVSQANVPMMNVFSTTGVSAVMNID